MFGLDLTGAVWAIGLIAGGYTIYGGLKAVVWSDLIQGLALLGGGFLVLVISLQATGGLGAFLAANSSKLHVMLPASHDTLPWTIYLMGIWIPNIAYWGLNQFITQRALAARSLSEGQKGILFAAFLKLLIPFLVVFPGIAAYELYRGDVASQDYAYPFLMTKLLPVGLRGFMFAALFGAVMSTLDSMLNSASTIFTIDIYGRHLARRKLSPKAEVRIGRIVTAVFLVFACLLAPELAQMGGIYEYMQRVWNFIWPGILAVFLLGLVLPKAPPGGAVVALLISPAVYGGLMLYMEWRWQSHAFLNAAAGACIVACAVIVVANRFWPLAEARRLPERHVVALKPHPAAKLYGAVIIALTVTLYILFW